MPARFKALATLLLTLAVFVLWAIPAISANSVSLVSNLDDHQAQLTLKPSSSNAVNFDVNVDAIGVEEQTLAQGAYETLNLPSGEALVAGKSTDVGEPEMPTLTTLIAIPDMAGVTLNTSYDSFEIIDNIDVMPAQVPEPEGGFDGPVAFARNADTYSQDKFFPENIASTGDPLILRDVRVVQVAVYPVQYNPARHQLKVYHNVSVSISYDGEVVNPKTIRRNYISEEFLPLYKSYVANWDEFYRTTLSSVEVKRGGILIICPDVTGYDWVADMRQIADWKRKKGYDVVLATTHDVDPSDGRPSQTQVKSYIQNAYNTWEVQPEFIYIVGDEDRIIPDYPYSSYPSDHPYSMLEGSDYLPDAAVARVSVDNINELRAWIAKVVEYEIYPDITNDPEYWKRAIMVAGGNQTMTCVWTVQWTKERLEQVGFVHIDTVFEENYNDPPDYLMTNPITAGVGYVNYRGWAGSSGWYDPSYNTSSLNQCQNTNKPGIMTSIVCGTGDFGSSYDDPCFGETWIRMGSSTAPRGGPCFFGCTDHNTHTTWNNPLTIGLYHGLTAQGIYHFGTAVIAGKLNQFDSYPRAYSTIQQYFHTYNMLGDPECEMRLRTPEVINVDYPENVEAGVNGMEITVTGEGDRPVANAYVTLAMGSFDDEAFYCVTKTDDYGHALLEVPTDTTGELALTVTGRDLNPYLGTVTVASAEQTIAPESFEVNDDMFGNGDGAVNPSESVGLTVNLHNFGSSVTAQNVSATLTSMDESQAVVNGNTVTFGNIDPDQTTGGNGTFAFTAMPAAMDADELVFKLEISADNSADGWTDFLHVPVSAAMFSVDDIQISDNNRLDPGETADVTITLQNNGSFAGSGLMGTLTTTDGYIQVSTAPVSFGDIAIDGTGSNATPFGVTVHEATFEGKNVPFVLHLTSADGAQYDVNLNLVVGSLSATDPAGPDAYGYYAYDNTDVDYPEHPVYEWTEIRGIPGSTNLYQSDDSKDLVDLPFDFTYYGDRFNRITVCSNGWISMDSTQWIGFRNWRLPSGSYAQTMVAPFWDDLGPSGSDNVYTYNDVDNHRFIVEWSQVRARWNTSVRETFQVILYDPAFVPSITGDGIIEFVYNDITNSDGGSGENYCSVGWEDSTENIGFSISYSNTMSPGCATLTDHRVYRITTNNGRGGVAGNVTVQNGDFSDIMVESSTGQWGMADETGYYAVRDIIPGNVDVTISKDGWFPANLTGIPVSENIFSSGQNATISQCPIPQNLEATSAGHGFIHLEWSAVDHADLAGYAIYRSNYQYGIFAKVNSNPVNGTTFDDYFEGVDGNSYWYYVQAVFEGDDYEAVSLGSDKDNADFATGINDQVELPKEFSVAQNYPNPFNAQTMLSFAMPEGGHVTVQIFNVLGQEVRNLYDGYHDAGFVSLIWNGHDDSGSQVSSGMYFFRIATDKDQATKRMMLLK